jgi:hypothetical protein
VDVPGVHSGMSVASFQRILRRGSLPFCSNVHPVSGPVDGPHQFGSEKGSFFQPGCQILISAPKRFFSDLKYRFRKTEFDFEEARSKVDRFEMPPRGGTWMLVSRRFSKKKIVARLFCRAGVEWSKVPNSLRRDLPSGEKRIAQTKVGAIKQPSRF